MRRDGIVLVPQKTIPATGCARFLSLPEPLLAPTPPGWQDWSMVGLLTAVFLVSSLYFQAHVFATGWVGLDSAIYDNVASEFLRSFRLAGDPTLILVPNDASGRYLDFDAVNGRKICFFTIHFMPSYALFALFRWLWSPFSAGNLYAIAAWVSLSIPFFYFGLRALGFGIAGAGLVVAAMFYGPLGSGALNNAAHPVCVAILYFAVVFWALVTARARIFWIALLLALGTESSAAIVALGAVAVPLVLRNARLAVSVALVSAAAFVVASLGTHLMVRVEDVTTDRAHWEMVAIGQPEGMSGHGPLGILRWIAAHPGIWLDALAASKAYWFLGLAAVLSFFVFFPSITGAAAFLAAVHKQLLLVAGNRGGSTLYEFHWHYSALLVPAAFFIVMAWKYERPLRAAWIKEPMESRLSIFTPGALRALFFVQVSALVLASVALGARYSSWWPSKYWFSIQNADKRSSMPANLFGVRDAFVASTSRPMTGFAYRNRIFSLDYATIAHAVWPQTLEYAIFPTDLASDEWSFPDIGEVALLRRAIAEKRDYVCIAEERGYTLWRRVARAPQDGCSSRLVRRLPAEALMSRHAASYDGAFFRKASNKDRTYSFGPYVPLVPAERTSIRVELDVDPGEPIDPVAPVLEIALTDEKGRVIRKRAVPWGEITQRGAQLSVDRDDILAADRHQVVLTATPESPLSRVRVRGIELQSQDRHLQQAKTFPVLLRGKETALSPFVPEGEYRVLFSSHRLHGATVAEGASRAELDGHRLTIRQGEGRAVIIAEDWNRDERNGRPGLMVLQLEKEGNL